jgi:hypothetical protein
MCDLLAFVTETEPRSESRARSLTEKSCTWRKTQVDKKTPSLPEGVFEISSPYRRAWGQLVFLEGFL